MGDDADFLDGLLAEWAKACPTLDTDAFGVTTRVVRLARLIEKRLDGALAPLGVALWQFEVMSTLLPDAGGPGVHVCRLLPASLLSPAAMTNRLDRLETAGWIERLPDPEDRRATRIRLTEAGREITLRAFAALGHADCPLATAEAARLNDLLRKILRSLCDQPDADGII